MFERIEGHPTQALRRRITQILRDPPMGSLMDGDRKKNGQDRDNYQFRLGYVD